MWNITNITLKHRIEVSRDNEISAITYVGHYSKYKAEINKGVRCVVNYWWRLKCDLHHTWEEHKDQKSEQKIKIRAQNCKMA